MSSSTAVSSGSAFLNLPPELRLIIYQELAKGIPVRVREQLLGPNFGPIFIIPETTDDGPELIFNDRRLVHSQGLQLGNDRHELLPSASILRTCRSIRQEALCEFIRAGNLHLSIRSYLPLQLEALPQLLRLQHLSVDYAFLSPDTEDWLWIDGPPWSNLIEGEIAQFLCGVLNICGRLETFTLYIKSDVCEGRRDDAMHSVLEKSARASRPAVVALTDLIKKVRDGVVLVAYGSNSAYPGLREAISSSYRGWPPLHCGRLATWPCTKKDPEQNAATNRIWKRNTTKKDSGSRVFSSNFGIMVWTYAMPSSQVPTAELIPDWKFMKDGELFSD